MSSATFKGLIFASLIVSLTFGDYFASAVPNANILCTTIKTRINLSKSLSPEEKEELNKTVDKYCLRVLQ